MLQVPGTKSVLILYDQVTVIAHAFRTYGRDSAVVRETAALRKALEEPETNAYLGDWVDCLLNTVDLEFQWLPDAPPQLRALEDFWKQYRRGLPIVDAFRFYSEHVDNLVMVGQHEELTLAQVREIQLGKMVKPTILVKSWPDGIAEAQTIWKPAHEKMVDNMTEEERADPKS